MDYLKQAEPSTLSIFSISNAPKKRTIGECAQIFSTFGRLINYKKQSPRRVRFFVELMPDKIAAVVSSLEDSGFIDHDIKVDIIPTDGRGRLALVNICLDFKD